MYKLRYVAAQLGYSPETIRKVVLQLERSGELAPILRTRGRQRMYTAEDIARLRAILYPSS